MQRVTLVRYTTKSEHADENERLARAVFAEVERAGATGFSYALFRNGADFTHVFINWREDEAAAVTGLASFKRYAANLSARLVAPPEQIRVGAELVEAYGWQRALAPA